MLHMPPKDPSCDAKSKPLRFLLNLFKRKRVNESNVMSRGVPQSVIDVSRVPSTLSVRDVTLGCPCPVSPARTRDIDADMEALRASRQDNPYIKQVLASRESLVESMEESESDDIKLMSQEFLNELETDPMTLPEVHEHLIRSPPPTSWPRSPNFKMFRFPNDPDHHSSQESVTCKSPHSTSASPRLDSRHEFLHYGVSGGGLKRSERGQEESSGSLLSPRFTLPTKPYIRSTSDIRERNFSLLTPAPLRSLTDVRRLSTRTAEDSQQLVTPTADHLIS